MALQGQAAAAPLEPSQPPAAALRGLLADLAAVVATLQPEAYTVRLLPKVSGSIGEHVRHCLDHVSALVAARPSAALTYDSRARGTRVETDPAEALRLIMRLDAGLARWPGRPLDEPVHVTGKLSTSQQFAEWSSLGRELAFVVNHTIHHQALIAVLLATIGAETPDRFGYAPSSGSRE